jgi:hypothetical protein
LNVATLIATHLFDGGIFENDSVNSHDCTQPLLRKRWPKKEFIQSPADDFSAAKGKTAQCTCRLAVSQLEFDFYAHQFATPDTSPKP